MTSAGESRWFFCCLTMFWIGVWIISAIRPVNVGVWALENLLAVAGTLYLIRTRRSLPLSRASYVCCAVFLALHEVGAHYTYLRVPAGEWIRPLLGLARNDYDRLVHFGFGILITLPVYETLRPYLKSPRWFTYVFPVVVMMAASAVYEIFEAYVVLVAPGPGTLFNATQGDPFDSDNDMACAMFGSILCMIIVAIRDVRRSRVTR